MDGAGPRPRPCRPGRGVSGVPAGPAGLAEHGEVLRSGVGAVVGVSGAVRAGLGRGDAGGRRRFPDLVAYRGRPQVVSLEPAPARFAESTIAVRVRAVLSCYTYHQLNGVDVGRELHRITHGRGGSYKPLLEHIARRKGRRQAVIRVRQSRQVAPPTLTPGQIERICDACASWDDDVREWRGSVRNRLLWSLLAETGLRLGEALGLQHRDWCTGRGDTPFIEVVPRGEEVRAKSGYRRLYISDEVDRSTASTYGTCASSARTWSPTTSTPAASSSTSTGNRASPRGSPTASMTWWTGSAVNSQGKCPRDGHPTGSATPIRPPCCFQGSRRTW